MKKLKTLLSLILVLALVASVGCSAKKDFSYSDGIADNGYWKNIKALDHVELCEYVGISIPSNIYEVSDESVQAEVDTILAQYTSKENITDRAVVDGDTVNIDYVGSVDGVEFEGGSTNGSGTEVTIGVTNYIDDFLEQLIGHTPGESFDIEVTFPADYGKEDLNGKDAVFAITLNHIVETITPELTDEFVKEKFLSSYGWDSIAKMKEDIKSDLQNSAVAQYIQEYIVENTTIKSLPERLLKYQEKSMIHYYQGSADSYGLSLNEYLSTYMGVSNSDELLKKYLDNNKQIATFYLIIQAIAEDAGISVNDDDVGTYFKEYMKIEDYSKFEESYGMPYLKLVALNQKVINHMDDKAVRK